jgi:hypothetical protein
VNLRRLGAGAPGVLGDHAFEHLHPQPEIGEILHDPVVQVVRDAPVLLIQVILILLVARLRAPKTKHGVLHLLRGQRRDRSQRDDVLGRVSEDLTVPPLHPHRADELLADHHRHDN